ncbi:MAG: hypothetical protein AUK35_01345 [Zetaproteobacteria bacterium CG2_30_46_52]|nr:MAG: hypothetical protein AUK35_01345 [Zetaproteobacteria bacterium CG2_30_46_52]
MASITNTLTSFFKFIAIFGIFMLFSAPIQAEEAPKQMPPYGELLSLPEIIYDDYLNAYDRVFDWEQAPYWWAVGLSTAALLATDDKWIAESQRLGRKLHLSEKDRTTTVASYKDVTILRLPRDTGSFMYFIGDGWTHASIAAGFLAVGTWGENEKAYNVGYQLIEGMISTTIATQTLKHITGHETPDHASKPGGRWDFFPNQRAYFDCVPCYDAFPSGHLAVGSMTLTVIAKNYPDNPWIVPVGSTLLSMLSFQMMNNGVHWASDYPLAIALGYTFGTMAYERGLRESNAMGSGAVVNNAIQWTPLLLPEGLGLAMRYDF